MVEQDNNELNLKNENPAESEDEVMDDSFEEEESFADLLEQSSTATFVSVGQMIKGYISSLSKEVAFINIGAKSEANIDLKEIRDENGELQYGMGDEIEATVISLKGGIKLSIALMAQAKDAQMLVDAYENNIPVEGKIAERNKGGFDVTVGGKKAFLPVSQVELGYCDNPDEHIGKVYRFRITEFNESGNNMILSRKQLLQEERSKIAAETRSTLAVGEMFKGIVTRLMPYGAFIDLGGVEGMVHISEMSFIRISEPSEVVSKGDEIWVKIKDINKENGKISLSMKSEENDPWLSAEKVLKVGESYKGDVKKLMDFGAFVQVLPGIEGLVHISEMSWSKRINHPSEVLNEGDEVTVVILSIDFTERKIQLSLKQVDGNPWDQVSQKFKAGQVVVVKVQKIAPFGLFAELDEGVVGLIPSSETGTKQGTDLHKHFKPGDSISVRVLAIDIVQKKIALSIKEAQDDTEKIEVDKYLKSHNKVDKNKGLGTFGDLLKIKMEKK